MDGLSLLLWLTSSVTSAGTHTIFIRPAVHRHTLLTPYFHSKNKLTDKKRTGFLTPQEKKNKFDPSSTMASQENKFEEVSLILLFVVSARECEKMTGRSKTGWMNISRYSTKGGHPLRWRAWVQWWRFDRSVDLLGKAAACSNGILQTLSLFTVHSFVDLVWMELLFYYFFQKGITTEIERIMATKLFWPPSQK